MLYIHGMGHFHPENEINNQFLEELEIGTSHEWVMERVGIETRRTVLPLSYIKTTRNKDPREANKVATLTNAQTGVHAAQMALERAGVDPSQIGLVISGGCSPHYSIPAEACMVAAKLGIEAPAFDVNSACSSFVNHLHYLKSMKEEEIPEYVLIMNIENNTRTINYNERETAVLWGDGSAAAVVSVKHPSSFKLAFSLFDSSPQGWNAVCIPVGGHFSQKGSQVQKFAIKKTIYSLDKLLKKTPKNLNNFYFIGHQANLRMLESVCQRMNISPSRHLYNVNKYGNCGAAGAPGVLSQNWDKFEKGDTIALTVVGSGLCWGGCLIQVV